MKGRQTVGAENKQAKSWSSDNRTGSVTCLQQTHRKPFFLARLRTRQRRSGALRLHVPTGHVEGPGMFGNCGFVVNALVRSNSLPRLPETLTLST